ncbi:MAG: site-specific DNA-methyltransferase [Chloroflexi bacterium]|nr:site-specific DNA-methyltransferase [Chloroflexota bacterium]
MIVTSPPYFGHRVYSQEGDPDAHEFGREQSPIEYVEKLKNLFQHLYPALKNDGTLWLNLGDTYRNGQLLGIPWRVAFALQEVGWILRSEVIWHKPNAMPSSVATRPTVDHETIFLFSKSNQYYYDADSIREPP